MESERQIYLEGQTEQYNMVSHTGLDSKDYINLLDYIEIIACRWKLMAKVVTLSAVISAVITFFIPNTYSSTALILPPQQDAGLLSTMLGAAGGMGGMAADFLGKGSQADMYVGLLNSENMSDSLIDRFNLMKVYDEKYRVDTYKTLKKNVDIYAGKKDGIINITVNDKDPKQASAMANAYVEELSRLLVKLNIAGAAQNRTYLEERLSKSKANLLKAENDLKLFQSKNKTLDIAEQTKGTIKGLADLEGQLAAEEIKLTGIKRVFTDSSQEVKNQQVVVTNIKSQIAKFEGNRSNASIPGVSSVPELGQQYLRLMREFKIQETLVELLTKQYEMSKLSEAKDTTGIQVVQVARVPDKKSKPRRSLIVFATMIVTTFSVISYIILCSTIKRMSTEELAQLTRIKKLLPNILGIRLPYRNS